VATLAGGMGILIPLAIVPRFLSFNFDATPKALVVLGAAAALLLIPAAVHDCVQRLLRSPSGKWFLVFVVAGAGSLVLSTALSSDPWLSLFGTRWRHFGAVTQVALLVWAMVAAGSFVARPESLRMALRMCSVAAILAGLYAILQLFGVDPVMDLDFYKLNLPGQVMRPPASFGHAGYFAGFESVVFFTALASALRESKSVWRAVHFLAAAMAVIGVLVSGTRAGVVAIAFGLAIVFGQPGTSVIRGKVLVGLLALVAVVAGGILLTPSGKNLRERAQQWGQDPGGTRLPLWKDTLALVAARPIVGSGPEMFVVSFPAYQSKSLTIAYPDFQHESPHNMFLDVMASQGLVGLAVLMFGVGLAVAFARKAPAQDRPTARLLLAGLAACVLFHQFFVFTLPNAGVFLLLIAALAALADPRAGDSGPAEASQRSESFLFRAAVELMGSILLAALVQVALTDYRFARIHAALRRGDLEGAATTHQSAIRTQWLGYAPELWYSQQMNAAARALPPGSGHTFARAEANQASLLAALRPGEDRIVADYNRAVACALSGQLDEADHWGQTMNALAPNWYQPHWVLGRLRFQQGKLAEARGEAEAALALSVHCKPALHQQINAFVQGLAAQ